MSRGTQNIALGILALLAILAGANMVVASNRFVAAYDAYDRLGLSLSKFHYTDPDTPVEAEFVVTNPSSEKITVREIELRLRLGVHDVGGGEIRPGTVLGPGESLTAPVTLAINDRNLIRRADEPLDWQVSGRVQIQLSPAIDPVWVPFVVRYLPE